MRKSRILSRILGSPQDMTATVIILLGSVLSFAATFNGIFDFLDSSNSTDQTTRWLSIGLTGFIQGMIILTSVRVRRSKIFIKPIWFLLYVFAAFFSVAFATSFWISALEGDRLATNSVEGHFITIKEEFINYENSYNNFHLALNDLVHHCREAALEEDSFGTSCGYYAGKGTGPRYDLRIADSTTLSQISRDINIYKDKLTTYKNELEQITSSFDPRNSLKTQKELRDLLIKAAQTRDNPVIRNLKTFLIDRTASGGKNIEMSGDVFDCVDPIFERNSNSILREIEALPELPRPSSIVLYEGKNSSHAVRMVFDECFNALAQVLVIIKPFERSEKVQTRGDKIMNGPNAENGSAFGTISALPISIGVIVDFFIFVAALMTSRKGWLFPGGRSFIDRMDEELNSEYSNDEQIQKVRDLIIDEAVIGVSLYDVITQALDDSYRTVALPSSSQCLQKTLLRFMDLLCETGDARSCDPKSRLIKKHLERKGFDDKTLPPNSWILESKVNPSRLRIVVMIMESNLKVVNNSRQNDTINSSQLRLF